MKPAKLYVQETLNSMVNETFVRCMKSALRFPSQKRKLNSLANDTANFQIEMMKEIHQFSKNQMKISISYLEEFNFRIEEKRREIENRLKKMID